MADAAKRLRWRCRRGMRELDVLLETYLSRRGAGMDAAERALFERFLDTNDMDLHAWLIGRATPEDAAFGALVRAIRGVRGPAPGTAT